MASSSTGDFERAYHRGNEPHLLREVFRTYQALMTGFSRKTGMPASRFALMRLLALAEGEMGVMDISRQLHVNAAAVTRQVKDLEGEGLARRRPDSEDRRRSYVSLSPKGKRLFAEIHQRTHEFEQSLSSVLGAEQMRATAVVLAKLRTFIEGNR